MPSLRCLSAPNLPVQSLCQRRKTLRNSLRAGGFSIDGLDETTLVLRPEQLSPEGFVELARSLKTK